MADASMGVKFAGNSANLLTNNAPNNSAKLFR